MTEFTTQKGKVIHVAHQAVTVACSWASETPRKSRYSFSWEGNGTLSREKDNPPTESTPPESWRTDTDNHNQPDVDDSGILELTELEDYPDEEADRLWREEYEEQLKPD